MKLITVFVLALITIGCSMFGKNQLHGLIKPNASEIEKKQDNINCDMYASTKVALINQPSQTSCERCSSDSQMMSNTLYNASMASYEASRQEVYFQSFYRCMESKGYIPHYNGVETPGVYWSCDKKYCSFE